jgi:hypothetical protein
LYCCEGGQRDRNGCNDNNSLLPQKKNGNLDDPLDAILYGPSTQNKIERWWRELLERMDQ